MKVRRVNLIKVCGTVEFPDPSTSQSMNIALNRLHSLTDFNMSLPHRPSSSHPLQWINVDKPSERQKAETQKLVRGHVMRAYKREQRRKLTEAYNKARQSVEGGRLESDRDPATIGIGESSNRISANSSRVLIRGINEQPLLNPAPGGDWKSNSMLSHCKL